MKDKITDMLNFRIKFYKSCVNDTKKDIAKTGSEIACQMIIRYNAKIEIMQELLTEIKQEL